MREDQIAYLVGTPKNLLKKMEPSLLDKPWETVHEGMSVKLLEKDNELYVQARSRDRQQKENAMRRRKLRKLLHEIRRIESRLQRGAKISRDQLLRARGGAPQRGRAGRLVRADPRAQSR